MSQNKITVVICMYNAEKYIVETLISLKKQTYSNFDLLVLDDASTDDSNFVLKEYFDSHTEFDYELIRMYENKGTAFLRNYALKYVNTKYMMFFDADDIAKPNLISSLIGVIESNSNIIAVSCYSKYIDEQSQTIVGGQYIGPKNKEEFQTKAKAGKLIFMLPPTVFERHYALMAGGYRMNGFPVSKVRMEDLSEDLDLWSRMSDFYEHDKIMITIPEVLFYYRKITTSLSASKSNMFVMQEKIRYIKFNLKRRRNNLDDVDFVDYLVSLKSIHRMNNYRKDSSAYYYREAGFLIVNKMYFSFLKNILLSAVYDPFYIIDKLKSNIKK